MALGLLVWRLRCCHSAVAAALVGWLFALAWLGASIWWLFISMHRYGGLAAPLAALAVLALCAALALYTAFFCQLYWRLASSQTVWSAIIFAACWLLAELTRGRWLSGFPWAASGYAHIESPLAALAPWVGVYGMGAVAAGLAASLALPGRWLRPARWLPLLALAALCTLVAALPGWTRSSGTLTLRLLQGNIAQDEKFQASSGIVQALDWYGRALRQPGAELVLAPETALPMLPQQLPVGYWEALQQRFASGDQAALLGLPLGNQRQGYTNSAIALVPGQATPYRYDKYHLVPFGEFIPPLFRWFTELMNIPLGDFERGAVLQPSLHWRGQRLAPNICYEDLFGEELAARFADPSGAPTLLVNLSNIGWFGDTVAIDQHLNISRLRALEFERPMLRATNTGATAIIDHSGRVTQALPRYRQGVLDGTVQGRDGLTPYAWWLSRFGLWPLWLGALALLLAVRWRQPRWLPPLRPAR